MMTADMQRREIFWSLFLEMHTVFKCIVHSVQAVSSMRVEVLISA